MLLESHDFSAKCCESVRFFKDNRENSGQTNAAFAFTELPTTSDGRVGQDRLWIVNANFQSTNFFVCDF